MSATPLIFGGRSVYGSLTGTPIDNEDKLAFTVLEDALLGKVYAHCTHAVQLTTLSNGTAERWVGSCRREILDHVIALDERHLLRLMRDYVSYYHQDRVHDSLEKNTPDQRPIETKPAPSANVTSMPRLGGLHHRYSWREAA